MTTEKQLKERALQAFQLRKAGKSYPAIAAEMQCAIGSAFNYATKGREIYFDEYPEEQQHIQNLELSRLDDMTEGIFEQAKAGDCKAIETMLKIMERRARILGLDAPAKQEIETKRSTVSAEDLTDDELAAIIRAGSS